MFPLFTSQELEQEEKERAEERPETGLFKNELVTDNVMMRQNVRQQHLQRLAAETEHLHEDNKNGENRSGVLRSSRLTSPSD